MVIRAIKFWPILGAISKVFAGIGLLFLIGCVADSRMPDIPESKVQSTPNPTEAMVVFIRPSRVNQYHAATLFEITDGTPKFIGILSAWKKIAYPVAPGKHRFMVVSRMARAEFVDAELAKGKSYYKRAII